LEYVLGDGIGYIDFVDIMPKHDLHEYSNGDKISTIEKRVVEAARVSFVGDGASTEDRNLARDLKLLKFLLANGHTTPLEHVNVTMAIKTPLFVSKQIMRHRTWSFNEISRRYTSVEPEFYIPKQFRKQTLTNRQGSGEFMKDKQNAFFAGSLTELCENAVITYNYAISQGMSKELARMWLPQNMYTCLVGTVDLKNMIDFVNKRVATDAQWEIRVYAAAMQRYIAKVAPNIAILLWAL
jgi:thymidylate synthase (FAD)